MIINTRTGQPFQGAQVPEGLARIGACGRYTDDVLNRDSRAGGVTEGSDAGPTWSTFAITPRIRRLPQRRDTRRKTLTKKRAVARLRVAHRQVNTPGQ